MAIPSGSGTEVLKRAKLQGFDHSADNKIIDGVANHIYTILSVIVFNAHGSTATGVNLYIWPDASSGNVIDILAGQQAEIPAYGTYVFNDKFVMVGTDELIIAAKSGGGGNLDAWVSYIDQDWT